VSVSVDGDKLRSVDHPVNRKVYALWTSGQGDTSETDAGVQRGTRLRFETSDSLTGREERQMARKTIYCAQAFWRRGDRLIGGEVHRFVSRERAESGGEILLTGADGVAVFSVEGHPDEDLWDEPKLISRRGQTPALEAEEWVFAA